MTDGGCASSSRELDRCDLDDAFAAGEAAQRVRHADYLDAFAARLIAGPRKRESWEAPISPHQHDPAFARDAGTLITGLAQSIRAGIADSDGDQNDR
jgi:hypothetical protein